VKINCEQILRMKSTKNNDINDIYKSLVENYDYNIMYEPINIEVDEKEGKKDGKKDDDTIDKHFKKYIIDHNYGGNYYKESKLIENNKVDDEYNEDNYNDIMVKFQYEQDPEFDPLQDLRKAENYAQNLETELLKLTSEYEQLVIVNTNLHKTIEGGDNETIKHLSLAIKQLKNEISEKNVENKKLQKQLNIKKYTAPKKMTDIPDIMFNPKPRKRRHEENTGFQFTAPPIIPPQSPFQFQ